MKVMFQKVHDLFRSFIQSIQVSNGKTKGTVRFYLPAQYTAISYSLTYHAKHPTCNLMYCFQDLVNQLIAEGKKKFIFWIR